MQLLPPFLRSYQHKRYFFFAANFLFLLCGILSLAVGVWLYLEKNDFIELTPSSYSALSAAGLCVFSGATVCIISVVGCMGGNTESKCLLLTYILFSFVLCFVEGISGLTGFFYKTSAKEHVRHDLLANINRTHFTTHTGKHVSLQLTWAHLHREMECCGADGPSDWFGSVQWPYNEFVPDSCCDPEKFSSSGNMTNCGKAADDELWYTRGCFEVFSDWLFHHIRVVTVMASIMLAVEVLVLTSSLILYFHLKKRRQCRSVDDYHYRKGSKQNEDVLIAQEK